MSSSQKEYVDYDIYLDESFSAVKFANSLVLATNNPNDMDIDLLTPNKRLVYDMEEVDQLISKITDENYEELLGQAHNVEIASEGLQPVKTALESVNSSYSKLQRDIIHPYEKCQKMHSALRRLHLTSSLLRVLTWYLYVARQLDGLLKSKQPDAIYQAVLNIKELRKLVEKNPGLQSLNIVRTHGKLISEQETKLKNKCLLKAHDFSLSQDQNELTYAFRALYLLSPTELPKSVSSYVKSQITATSNQLFKSLSASIVEFEGAASDARSRARAINAMSGLLSKITVATHGDPESSDTFLNIVERAMDVQSLISSYWRDVASHLDSRIREMVIRNPALSRSLQPHTLRMQEMAKNSVVGGGGVSSTGLEVKVMMNSFSSLIK